MMEFPKVYQAAKRAKGAEWALCDALAEEIPAGRAMEPAIKRCAGELAAHGIEYSTKYLFRMRQIGVKFEAVDRPQGLTPSIAATAGTPTVVRKAEAIAEDEGVVLSQRLVDRVRKATSRATKTLPKKKSKAEVAAHIDNMPVSEVRRQADSLKLAGLAMHAGQDAREFIKHAAGFEMSAQERKDIGAQIDKAVEAWAAAQDLLLNPVAADAEEFLRSIS
jgi:hypothetical protein